MDEDVALHARVRRHHAEGVEAGHVEPPLVQPIVDRVHGHRARHGHHALQRLCPVLLRTGAGVDEGLEDDVPAGDAVHVQESLLDMLRHSTQHVPEHVPLDLHGDGVKAVKPRTDVRPMERAELQVVLVSPSRVRVHKVPPVSQCRVIGLEVHTRDGDPVLEVHRLR